MMSEIPPPTLESYWVRPGRLLAGPYPGSCDLARAQARITRYLEAGVSVFVDLTHAGENTPYAPLLLGKARHLRMPIADFGVPWPDDMTDILDAIDDALATGKIVYVHCLGGLGRTGTVVGCYLARQGMTGAEALVALRELRQASAYAVNASPETDAQCAFVLRWASGT